MREYHVRICEGLGVQLPGSTRHLYFLDHKALLGLASIVRSSLSPSHLPFHDSLLIRAGLIVVGVILNISG